MIIKKRAWSKCQTCQSNRTLINEDIYGCDVCKRVLDMNKKSVSYLDATKFSQRGEATHHHFCSWRCLVKWVIRVKCDNFISLPFLSFDGIPERTLTREFMRLTREGRKP